MILLYPGSTVHSTVHCTLIHTYMVPCSEEILLCSYMSAKVPGSMLISLEVYVLPLEVCQCL